MTEWRDKETLEKLYHGEKMSQKEVAEELGTNQGTVSEWMDKLGVETRSRSIAVAMKNRPLNMRTNNVGYEYMQTKIDAEPVLVTIHRLLAVSEFGFREVGGKVVHHKNNIPWDNRPDNIKLMDDSEHKRMHAEKQAKATGGDENAV